MNNGLSKLTTVFSTSLLLLAGVMSGGCATTARQTESLLKTQKSSSADTERLQKKLEVANVPFFEQKANYCGPATLAMAMTWAGHPTTPDQIAEKLFTPGVRGSFQTDMVSAARRSGMLAIPMTSLPNLLKEISAGHPVIIFEDLAFNWAPQWHYALAYGFDLEKEKILFNSGPDHAKWTDMRRFERSWELGDYWALVVLPPGQLAEAADELAHANAASSLETLGKQDEAALVYQSIVKRWPESLSARVGLANLAFAKKDFREAVIQLTAATKAHPEAASAFHNLAIAQGANNQKQAAGLSAKRAVELAPEASRAAYRENLKDWL